MAHVGRRKGHAAQHVEPAGAVAGLLLELAVGRLFGRLAGIDAALDQAQLVTVHAGGVFAYQQHGFVVQHRHHHHRAMAAADHALEPPALAIGEFQVQALKPVRSDVLGGGLVDDREAPAHGKYPRRGRGAADIMAGCTNVIMSREC